jgi:hypothetical protein
MIFSKVSMSFESIRGVGRGTDSISAKDDESLANLIEQNTQQRGGKARKGKERKGRTKRD